MHHFLDYGELKSWSLPYLVHLPWQALHYAQGLNLVSSNRLLFRGTPTFRGISVTFLSTSEWD
ncbi:hypothetical protein A2U01_0042867, partial [Trifolium medium]|nr:hypothetical protein [Trifolium medium]